jgi:hypothetical protein
VFRDEVARDAAITALLSPEKLAKTFDYTRQLGNVDAILGRSQRRPLRFPRRRMRGLCVELE